MVSLFPLKKHQLQLLALFLFHVILPATLLALAAKLTSLLLFSNVLVILALASVF